MLCLFLLIATLGVAQQPPVIDWNVSWFNACPDGVCRNVITVNNQWPPPTVRVKRRAIFTLRVYNQLNDGECITIHTHGIDQWGNNPYDGVDGVTQCGIPPGQYFDYTPNLQDQVGTYWFHTHIKGQYPEGLRAPFIVDDLDVPFQYDFDEVLSVSDWYDRTMKELIPIFWDPDSPVNAETPDAALINDVQNSTIPVERKAIYRFHIVNTAAIALFHVWIEGHNMTVIEVDGVYVKPYLTQGVDVAVGQRYSVLVTMNADPSINYPIVAAMDGLRSPSPRPNTTAWLQYNSSATLPSARNLTSFYPFDDTNLTPLLPVLVSAADHNVTLAVTFATRESDGNTVAQINGISYVGPDAPTMLTAMDAPFPLEPYNYGPTTNSYILRHNRMIWLIIENKTGGSHPFHLHGHTFQVLYRSDQKTSYNPSKSYPIPENPVRRDVIVVKNLGFVILAFRADNPGVWFLHCHIDWHVLMGMIAQFVEAPDVMQQILIVPPEIRKQCDMNECKAPTWSAGKGKNESTTTLRFQAHWWEAFVDFFHRLFRLKV